MTGRPLRILIHRTGMTVIAAALLGSCGLGNVGGEAIEMATEYAREDAEAARTSIQGILHKQDYSSVDEVADKAVTVIEVHEGKAFNRSIDGSIVHVGAAFTQHASAGGGLLADDTSVRLCVRYLITGSQLKTADMPCPSDLTPAAEVTINP